MLAEVMEELAELGTAQTKKTLMNHGAVEPVFGVRIGDLKKELVKKYRHNKSLAWDLMQTENSDAQYLAGLIMPMKEVSAAEILALYPTIKWFAMIDAVLAPMAADSGNGLVVAQEWLNSSDNQTYHAGVITLAKTISITADADLDCELINQVLQRLEGEFSQVSESLQYSYNNFLIILGINTESYHLIAQELLGQLPLNHQQPGCQFPDGLAKIAKISEANKVGKKRRKAMC